MEVALLLSKEHPTLPRAEVEAVLEAEKVDFRVKEEQKGLLIINVPDHLLPSLKIVADRLSYTHEIFRLLIETENGQLETSVSKYPWEQVINDTYAVRVKKIDKNVNEDAISLEGKIGSIIHSRVAEARVNLTHPSTFIRTVLTGDRIIIGDRIARISKKHFFELKPHKRPFFYPGSMSPKLARCMVNLTRLKKGETLLDPFCGTGGILLEAGIIGARVVGTDIDYKMVKGTEENLQHCGIDDYQLFHEDARKFKLPYQVDAIATDPPYGISASTGGEKSNELYQQSVLSMQGLIKDEGLVCLATPHYLDIPETLAGTNFEIIEQHHIRMHKSLTRVISLLEKI
jgi:tRNA (guanine10-N2)-dimethyltransferase